MVQHYNDPMPMYKGNYGVGVGKVYMNGHGLKDILKKTGKKLRPLIKIGINTLMEKGRDLYNENKGEIKKAIKEKAEDIVDSIVEKGKEKAPEEAKKQIVENSDLITSVSRKYIDDILNKAEKRLEKNLGGRPKGKAATTKKGTRKKNQEYTTGFYTGEGIQIL